MPEAISEAVSSQAGRLRLLRNNLLLSTLLFLGLQCWRHCYFLTDDNLDAGLPFFTEMGHHLLSGHSPFVSDYLFGGGYNLLRDPNFFAWHPLYFVVSLLAGTPFHLWILDVDAFFLLMLTTAGFVNLAWYLRRELSIQLSDGWLTFYAASFVYSMIAITTGASWLTFLGNQSALPWLTLGILQRSWWRGTGLVALFSLHQILGGHLEPLVFTSIFLSLFALGLSVSRRSFLPMGSWISGYLVALFTLLPLLVPMLSGFFSSARSHGVILDDMQANNIPALLLPTSLFLGTALSVVQPPHHLYVTYTLALGQCAASWCVMSSLVSRSPWRGLDVIVMGMLVLGVLLISSPNWLAVIMLHLPILKSMRWPFRELVQFIFFLHLFLVLRVPSCTPRSRFVIALFSTVLMLYPLFLFMVPPTFNTMNMDRDLLFSGGFDRYWAQVRPLLQPGDRIAVLIPGKIYADDRFQEPYSLLSTCNYSGMTRIINIRGYSPTAPSDQVYTRTVSYYPFGAYLPGQKAALLAERPDIKFITLESLKPLKISLSSRLGPTIDLTPYIPDQLKSP